MRIKKFASIAEAAKVTGNSAYGHTIINKKKFIFVRFCNEKQVNEAKNNYFFCDT